MRDADVHALLALVNDELAQFVAPASDLRKPLLDGYAHHLRRALELDRTQVLAASLKLSSSSSDGDPKGELTAGLVQAHPEDWRAWYWRARLASTPPEDARNALARVCELAPDRREVILLQANE
jgi:hypothetical protein